MELSELGLSAEQLVEVNKAIQSKEDKVRTDYSTKLKLANEEIAKLKPVDKTPEEIALEERQKALALKEKEIADKEKSYTVKDKLTAKGLPSELAKYLSIGDDVDTTLEEFGSAINSFLLNGTYKPDGHKKSEGMTKADFKNMNYSQRANLLETNPELYKKLAN